MSNEIIYKSRIKNAAKTNEEWLKANPILKLGEKVWVITSTNPFTVGFKVGDGKTKYENLILQFSQGAGSITYASNSVNLGVNTQAGTRGYRIVKMVKVIIGESEDEIC